MSRRRCIECRGVYTDVLPDGRKYFHVCSSTWDRDGLVETPRVDARDENVRGGDGADRREVKSEGRGSQIL